jgi:hypothetical protein
MDITSIANQPTGEKGDQNHHAFICSRDVCRDIK